MSIERIISYIVVFCVSIFIGMKMGSNKKHIPNKKELLNKKVFTTRGEKFLYVIIFLMCFGFSLYMQNLGMKEISESKKALDYIIALLAFFTAISFSILLINKLFKELKYWADDEVPKFMCTRRELYEDRGYSDDKINDILKDYYRRFYHCSDKKIAKLIGGNSTKQKNNNELDAKQLQKKGENK